jgi:hypothetical protein
MVVIVEVRQYNTNNWTPHLNLKPDPCAPVLPLAKTSLVPPKFYTHILYLTICGSQTINLFMSYRLGMKLFFILRLVNYSNFEKLSFGEKCIWLLNSESKDILICMCDFLLNDYYNNKLSSATRACLL